MSLLKKLAIFVFLLFITTQFTIPYFIPSTFVYKERVIYDVFKNDELAINTTIKQIKKTIDKEKLKNYIIILGDSVAYSNPCPPEKSIGFYMNCLSIAQHKNIRVFNLAFPSSMVGDVYTMILLLHKYGISTQSLIIDFCYWEFYVKCPVYWLKHNIKSLNPEIYNKIVLPNDKKKETLRESIKSEIKWKLDESLSLLQYRQFITYKISNKINHYLKEPAPIINPWYTKSDLPSVMKKPENSWYYSDSPMTLNDSNSEIFLLNKIIEMQKGKNTVYFLCAMNDKLLGEGTTKPGYIDNMKKIDNYFASKKVKFVDYNKKIDYNLFSDHVHLIPQGYVIPAKDLWYRINS